MAQRSTGRPPLVAVTCRPHATESRDWLPRAYAEALEAAGGTPLLVPLIAAAGYLDSVVAAVDGVVFSGSATDIDPRHYGQPPHARLGRVDAVRDAVDMELARRAIDRGRPVLGICYGFQMLNVTLGGSLIQDLPSLRHGGLEHEAPAGRPPARHAVRLAAGSLLERLAGTAEVSVNSHHHQAVARLAGPLLCTATAPDGLIEAAEHRAGLPVLGVQWHPEKDAAGDPFSRAILAHFISWCAGAPR